MACLRRGGRRRADWDAWVSISGCASAAWNVLHSAVATARWKRAAWAAADKYPSESILSSMACARESGWGGSVASAATVIAASATAREVKVCSSHSNSALIRRARSDGTTAGALRRASASAANRSPMRGLDCRLVALPPLSCLPLRATTARTATRRLRQGAVRWTSI